MRRTALILIALFCCLAASAQELPSCARADRAVLKYPGSRARMERFRERLQACAESPDSSVTIWHIGGSHVQAGFLPSRLRHNFDSLGHYPAGGRGYIFPYPLAGTNYDRSYNVGSTGEWAGARSTLPLKNVPLQPAWGILGIAAYTADTTASFGIGTPERFRRLHIMAEASEGVTPLVVAGADTLRCAPDSLLRGFVVDFPAEVDSVLILPSLRSGDYFMLTGLLPLIPDEKGVHFVSTGVNGARTDTWFKRCSEFEREASLLKPDLLILGLGINDSACPASQFKPEKFKANYRKLLEIMMKDAPDCAIVFITNNDSWRYAKRHRMVHNENGAAVERAMYELAAEYDAAVWDLFELMGGNHSAPAWRDAGLMKNDRLHFTAAGYRLLGDMLYRAIVDGE